THNLLVHRSNSGANNLFKLPFCIDEVLLEVPLYLRIRKTVESLLGQKLINRSHVFTLNRNLTHHREGYSVVHLTEFRNLFVSARLLTHKVVGWEPHNHKVLVFILFIERLQILILWGQPAFGSRVHNHNLFAFRSEEHTSELQSRENLVCRLLLEK